MDNDETLYNLSEEQLREKMYEKYMEDRQRAETCKPQILKELFETAKKFDKLWPDFFQKAAPAAIQESIDSYNTDVPITVCTALYDRFFISLIVNHPERVSELSIEDLWRVYYILKINYTHYKDEAVEEDAAGIDTLPITGEESLQKILERELLHFCGIVNKSDCETAFVLSYLNQLDTTPAFHNPHPLNLWQRDSATRQHHSEDSISMFIKSDYKYLPNELSAYNRVFQHNLQSIPCDFVIKNLIISPEKEDLSHVLRDYRYKQDLVYDMILTPGIPVLSKARLSKDFMRLTCSLINGEYPLEDGSILSLHDLPAGGSANMLDDFMDSYVSIPNDSSIAFNVPHENDSSDDNQSPQDIDDANCPENRQYFLDQISYCTASLQNCYLASYAIAACSRETDNSLAEKFLNTLYRIVSTTADAVYKKVTKHPAQQIDTQRTPNDVIWEHLDEEVSDLISIWKDEGSPIMVIGMPRYTSLQYEGSQRYYEMMYRNISAIKLTAQEHDILVILQKLDYMRDNGIISGNDFPSGTNEILNEIQSKHKIQDQYSMQYGLLLLQEALFFLGNAQELLSTDDAAREDPDPGILADELRSILYPRSYRKTESKVKRYEEKADAVILQKDITNSITKERDKMLRNYLEQLVNCNNLELFPTLRNNFVQQAKAYQIPDEDIDFYTNKIGSLLYRAISIQVPFQTTLSSVTNRLSNFFVNFEKLYRTYQGEESDLTWIEKPRNVIQNALATGEYLRYIYTSDSEHPVLSDYSCIALEYYLALESLANLLLYTPLYIKELKGNTPPSNNRNIRIGGTKVSNIICSEDNGHGGRRSIFRDHLELGSIAYLWKNFCKGVPITGYNPLQDGLQRYGDVLLDSCSNTTFDDDVKLLLSAAPFRNNAAHGTNNLDILDVDFAQDITYFHQEDEDPACESSYTTFHDNKITELSSNWNNSRGWGNAPDWQQFRELILRLTDLLNFR